MRTLPAATVMVLSGAIACVSALPAGCRTTEPAPSPSMGVERLVELMSGAFSSAEQADADPEAFRDIRLVMVPIWTDRDDGPWLYVEQAAATTPDRPYRQRVYRLTTLESGEIESAVFTLPGEVERFAGAWREERPLATLRPADLSRRDGCSMFLRAQSPDLFTGSTRGTRCSSDLRGARFATSEVTITPEGLDTWDRGYDENGVQVWGAAKGGYRFLRTAFPPQ